MEIINLTQHEATPAQVEAGVVPLPERAWMAKGELTFDVPPDLQEMRDRAALMVSVLRDSVAHEIEAVMIGGAPFFMPVLTDALRANGIKVLFAFSVRESRDLPDGRKVSVFRHLGFVEAPPASIQVDFIQ